MYALRQNAFHIAAFVWGFAEATLFFIVPDVLLTWIGLKRGAESAARSSIFAALGAGLGGALIYLWSARDPAAASAAIEAVPAVSNAMTARAFIAMQQEGWFWATLLGPLSSTPYKVFAAWAPHAGAPLGAFVAASVLARLPRFLLIGCGAALLARAVRGRLSQRQLLWLLAGAWVAFYAVFFALMPN